MGRMEQDLFGDGPMTFSGKDSMKYSTILFLVAFVLFVSACERKQTVCPEGSVTYGSDRTSFPKRSSPDHPAQGDSPAMVEIRGKKVKVDRIIQGPLCNDHLSGKVYIGCDIQIAKWADRPRFLEECNFTVEPGTVVYVAAHNDTVFKKGCACHTGKLKSD